MAEEETKHKDFYAEPPLPHEEGTEVMDLTVVNAAELNQQVVTARRFPRSITSFRRRVYELVTMDEDIAQACIYALPRDGKVIEGASIRFAEALMTCWGNCRASTAVTDVGEEFVTAEGMFFDLENNMAIKADTMRRIVNKYGKRYGADMIGTTGNAACSIALRNAILRGVPKAIWQDLLDEAKKVAGGTAQTFIARRDKVMKEIAIQGATPEAVFGLLGIVGLDDMKSEHVVQLRGLQNAIKDGEITVEAAFAPKEPEAKAGEVVPPRPKQSNFARDDKKPAEETKQKAEAKPEAEKAAAAEPAKAGPEAKQVAAADAQPSAAEAYEDWYKDQIAELAKITKVRDIGPLREMVREQADTPEREKDFDARCDARQKEIMSKVQQKK